jgi:hypothetical protein
MKQIPLLLLLLASASPLLGNDTSLHDGRFGPEPLGGAESPVRMVAEHIEVEFGYKVSKVHCTFTFRNTLKDQKVSQLVGFPDVGAACAEAGRRDSAHADVISERVNTSELRELRTVVDGRAVESKLKFGEVLPGDDLEGTAVWSFDEKTGLRAWHTVSIEFPPERDVKVERFYKVQNGASALGVAFFRYTTRSGAVWNGTIGRLQVDVTLRDGLTSKELMWPGMKVRGEKLEGDVATLATLPAKKSWEIVDPTHLRLVWTNFEPRTEVDHRGFSLSRPFHGFSESD